MNGNTSIDKNELILNVDKNGTYQFHIEDIAKNTVIAEAKVNSIPFEGEDTEKPEVNYLLDTYSWTNENVGICVYASDNQGIKSIKTPDGSIVEDSTVTYMVDTNGSFEFEVEDLSGNTETLIVDVSNIDKTLPIIETNIGNDEDSSNNVSLLNISLIDEESGIDNIILPNNVLVKGDSFTIPIDKDMEYEVIAKDNAGNENRITIKVEDNNNSPEEDDINNNTSSNNPNNNRPGYTKPNTNKPNSSINDSSINNTNNNHDFSIDYKSDYQVSDKNDAECTIENNIPSKDINVLDNDNISKLENEMVGENPLSIFVFLGIIVFTIIFIIIIFAILDKKEEDENLYDDI